MSSISSVGGDTTQRWQQLKDSRASQANESGAANRTRPSRGPPAASDPSAAGSVDASGNPTAAGSISGASAKVITDLKALFIDLQSSASATTGASGAAVPGATTATAPATATGTTPTATAAGASGAAFVQSDLQTLAGDLGDVSGGKVGGGKVGGHHGGRHAHHAPSADTASTDQATSPTTSAASTAGQPAAKPAGSIVDQLLGALKAYAASSNDNSAAAATGLNA